MGDADTTDIDLDIVGVVWEEIEEINEIEGEVEQVTSVKLSQRIRIEDVVKLLTIEVYEEVISMELRSW